MTTEAILRKRKRKKSWTSPKVTKMRENGRKAKGQERRSGSDIASKEGQTRRGSCAVAIKAREGNIEEERDI